MRVIIIRTILQQPNCICYTGTHDNDTTTGWYAESSRDRRKTKSAATATADGGIISLDFIRMCMGSIAKYAIFPIQDLFMQDSSCTHEHTGFCFRKLGLSL